VEYQDAVFPWDPVRAFASAPAKQAYDVRHIPGLQTPEILKMNSKSASSISLDAQQA
jgi:hypothetical protein